MRRRELAAPRTLDDSERCVRATPSPAVNRNPGVPGFGSSGYGGGMRTPHSSHTHAFPDPQHYQPHHAHNHHHQHHHQQMQPHHPHVEEAEYHYQNLNQENELYYDNDQTYERQQNQWMGNHHHAAVDSHGNHMYFEEEAYPPPPPPLMSTPTYTSRRERVKYDEYYPYEQAAVRRSTSPCQKQIIRMKKLVDNARDVVTERVKEVSSRSTSQSVATYMQPPPPPPPSALVRTPGAKSPSATQRKGTTGVVGRPAAFDTSRKVPITTSLKGPVTPGGTAKKPMNPNVKQYSVVTSTMTPSTYLKPTTTEEQDVMYATENMPNQVVKPIKKKSNRQVVVPPGASDQDDVLRGVDELHARLRKVYEDIQKNPSGILGGVPIGGGTAEPQQGPRSFAPPPAHSNLMNAPQPPIPTQLSMVSADYSHESIRLRNTMDALESHWDNL
eukprot:PhF_6_TR8738/c0_g1_i1/m.13745